MQIFTRKLPRQVLAKVFPDHKTLVAFEQLQEDAVNSGGALTTAGFVVVSADEQLGSERVLTGSSDVSVTDDGAGEPVILDLTDTGIDAGDYGSPTRILILGLSAKGRVVSAQEVKIDVSDVDGTLAVGHGGTGLTLYTVGDLLVATAPDTLSPLPDAVLGNVLKSGGVGVMPAYGPVDLTTDVAGVLPEANGGFPTGGFTGTVLPTFTSMDFTDGLLTTVVP